LQPIIVVLSNCAKMCFTSSGHTRLWWFALLLVLLVLLVVACRSKLLVCAAGGLYRVVPED
jgi:hypothetical protein